MMLVLVSVAMASMLATAYLVSRDNAVAITSNNAASMKARWASLSAFETTVALLQTETDWRLNHVNGMLLDGFELAGATVTVTALDIETNAAPDAASEHLRLLAVAEIDIDNDGTIDAHQSTVFLVYVPVVIEPRVAVGLDEFTIFARDSFTMQNDSTVAPWPTAPLNMLGARVNIGTHAQISGGIIVQDNAACIDCTVYHPDGASSTLINDTAGPPVSGRDLPFDIPFPSSAGHGEPGPVGGMPNFVLSGGTVTTTADQRFGNASVSGGAVWTLQGDIAIIAENDLSITGGAKVVIDGNVKLIVNDDLVLDGSSIELTPGSTLAFFIGDDATLNDAYIGEERADNTRDNTGNEEYMNPLDVQIFQFEAGTATTRYWKLQNNSVVKGTVYGESVHFVIQNDSALYGRFAGQTLTMSGNAGLFFDPSLDEQVGYTNAESPLYDGSGNLVSAYATGFTLEGNSLQTLADATGLTILANGDAVSPLFGPPPPPPPAAGDPTPRPVQIQTTLVTFGLDMSQWEHPASNESGGGGGAGGGGTALFGGGTEGIGGGTG